MFDPRRALLWFVFVIGGLTDWFFYRPSEAHWVGVGAAFLLLTIYTEVYITQAKLKEVQGKLDAILKKLNERGGRD